MNKIINPILRGFNPDPSIIRVGDDYYIATSTFEWFPGVQIHHSEDLVHWKLVARPLNRLSQIDMRGEPDSCGVWAPCLSYNNGTYYLVYTDVKGGSGGFIDTLNYLVTSQDICGDWSEPIFLNSLGFDPSMFHDDDGSKWLVGMTCDNTRKKSWFGGIMLQKYSEEKKSLVGPLHKIFDGTALGGTEGPHLYKKNGYYYLVTAEGGTSIGHSVTMARSRLITGPYEVDPQNPILTSRHDPTLIIQKAGHADIVETQNGETYMVHLCGRPLPTRGVCTLGRETSIQKMTWTKDDWLRMESGENKPQVKVVAPNLKEHKYEDDLVKDDFDGEKLNINFQSLRVPLGDETISLTERHGYLRLKGRESLSSKFNQSLIARRQQDFCYTAATCLEFEPECYKHTAGLICYYNTQNYHYIFITHDEDAGKCIEIMSCDNGQISFNKEEIYINNWERCYLKAEVDYDELKFSYSRYGKDWNKVGGILDASILSDEHCKTWWGFTGAFVGICCQDLTGGRRHADFDYFEYENKNVNKEICD